MILAPYSFSNKSINVEYAEGPTLITGSRWPYSNIHAGWLDNKMVGIMSEDSVNQTNMSLVGKLDPQKLQIHFRRCWYRYQREMNEFLLSNKIKKFSTDQCYHWKQPEKIKLLKHQRAAEAMRTRRNDITERRMLKIYSSLFSEGMGQKWKSGWGSQTGLQIGTKKPEDFLMVLWNWNDKTELFRVLKIQPVYWLYSESKPSRRQTN